MGTSVRNAVDAWPFRAILVDSLASAGQGYGRERPQNKALRDAIPVLDGDTLEWRAPLATMKYAEPQDGTFWPGIEEPDLRAAAAEWWPGRGGPSWDAVALTRGGDGMKTVVLAEAKADVPEFGDASCAATSPRSVRMIHAALDATRSALGATGEIDQWVGSYYQLANRLSWTHWLRTKGVDAVFAHVLFENDGTRIPTGGEALRTAAHAGHLALGVPPESIAGWTGSIVLPSS